MARARSSGWRGSRTIDAAARLRRRSLARGFVRAVALLLTGTGAGCASPEGEPTAGTFTLAFPSTAAAVASESVQVLAFDLPLMDGETPVPNERACLTLLQRRKQKEQQRPSSVFGPMSVCALRQASEPLMLAYGPRALVAVTQRQGADFLVGCSMQSVGSGDLVEPIRLALVDVSQPVPSAQCSTLAEACRSSSRCAK